MKNLTVIVLFLFLHCSLFSQEVSFSQPFASKIILNPAFSGSGNSAEAVLVYRNHFPGVANAYETYAFTINTPIDFMNGGLGLSIVNDRFGNGAFAVKQVNFVYVYNFRINTNFIVRTAAAISYQQMSYDFNKMIFADALLNENGITLEQNNFQAEGNFGFSFASLLNYKKIYFGAVTKNLQNFFENKNSQNSTFHQNPEFTFHIGSIINQKNRARSGNKFSPNIIFKFTELANTINYGFYFNTVQYGFGLWYRHDLNLTPEALVFAANFSFADFYMGYSFDFPISSTKKQTFGAHELTFGIKFAYNKTKRRAAVECPEM